MIKICLDVSDVMHADEDTQCANSERTFTCSKWTVETAEKGVRYVQS